MHVSPYGFAKLARVGFSVLECISKGALQFAGLKLSYAPHNTLHSQGCDGYVY